LNEYPPYNEPYEKPSFETILEKHRKMLSETVAEFHAKVAPKPTKRRFLPLSRFGRIAAMFVAIIVAAVIVGHGVAVAMGYDNILDLIRSAFSSSDRAVTGSEENDLFLSDNRIYNSFEEMLAAENLNILYPARLPVGYSFATIEVVELDNFFEVRAMSNESYITFWVEFDVNHQFDSYEYEINGIKFNILEHDETYQACWVIENNYYRIVAADRAVLSEIIENLTR
jgi:hypothetical protein